MNLLPAEEREGMVCRLVSEDGQIEIGVYPVMYGFRIRAGFNGYGCCELDWCCGAKQEAVEYVYSALKHILEQRTSDDAFKGLLRCSDIKPLFNDIPFFMWLVQTAGDFTIVKLPDLNSIKQKELLKYFQTED